MKSFKEFIEESAMAATRTPKFGDGQLHRAHINGNIIKDKIKAEYKSGKIDQPTLLHTAKKIEEVLGIGRAFAEDAPQEHMMGHITGIQKSMDRMLERGSKTLNKSMADHTNKHLNDLYNKISDYTTDYASHGGK